MVIKTTVVDVFQVIMNLCYLGLIGVDQQSFWAETRKCYCYIKADQNIYPGKNTTYKLLFSIVQERNGNVFKRSCSTIIVGTSNEYSLCKGWRCILFDSRPNLEIETVGNSSIHVHSRTGRGVRWGGCPPNSGSLSTIRAESRHYSGKTQYMFD